MISFWRWLIRGTGSGPGLRRFLDRWLIIHLVVGVAMTFLLPIPIRDAATSLLLPLAGIFIGLSFAWGGNAQALLQTDEIEGIAEHNEGGYEEYIYTFQAAILLILLTLVLWGLAGVGIFDLVWPADADSWAYKAVVGTLFLFFSFTLRECWHVVLGAQTMLLIRFHVRKRQRER